MTSKGTFSDFGRDCSELPIKKAARALIMGAPLPGAVACSAWNSFKSFSC
ncbi:hypothetical protein ALP75_200783 [Pseudomonas syringae pv. actinidiae]|nr:hypothetical protein ALP75_200783 [Pseudomonas syringae pv. actinidiae]